MYRLPHYGLTIICGGFLFHRQAGWSDNGHYTEMSVYGINETMSVFVSIYMIYP